MSVIVYDENKPHPSGGHCIRVARCVDGKPRQRYLPLTRAALGSAYALDAQWEAEQQTAALKRKQQARPTARAEAHTTVRGIRFTVHTYRKTNQSGKTHTYQVPVFEVSISENQERYSPKRFVIESLGYEVAWKRAVAWLAKHKGIADASDLLARMPAKTHTLGTSDQYSLSSAR